MMFRGKYDVGRIVVISVLAVATLLAGCHRAHVIDVGKLSVLDGFTEWDKIEVVDLAEQGFYFTRVTTLTFWLSTQEVISHTYRAIIVNSSTFMGITPDGKIVSVPLAQIEQAAVTVGTPGRVAGIVGLSTVGGAIAVALIIGAFYVIYIILKVLFTHEH